MTRGFTFALAAGAALMLAQQATAQELYFYPSQGQSQQ